MAILQRELREALSELEVNMDIVVLLRLRDQLKQQLMDCRAAFHTSQENYLEHAIEETFFNATEDLERDLEELKVSFQNKTLALQRIQLMFALRNKMKQNDDDSRRIVETLRCIVMLSQAVIEYQQQAREKEHKLIDVKMKRLSLKKDGEKKLLQIHTMMKTQKQKQTSVTVSTTLDNMRNNLQKERVETTIIQNLLQNIIIGSRINWAQDPSLKAIVLKLEKNVYLL